jgi:hypothetical protein
VPQYTSCACEPFCIFLCHFVHKVFSLFAAMSFALFLAELTRIILHIGSYPLLSSCCSTALRALLKLLLLALLLAS